MKRYDTYKDSWIEWIGEIPSHWEVCRIKDFTSLITEKSTSSEKIGLENIEGKSGRFITTISEFEGDGISFKINDIVYGKLRPYLQKVWLASFEGNAVGDFFVFRTKKNSLPKYLFYLMLSDGFTSKCNGATLGAKMPRVSSDFIRTLTYYLPPLEEQEAIAAWLDVKCGEIDNVIATQERRIELLQELRQSIITRAVTRGINPDAPLKPSGFDWIGDIPANWTLMRIKFLGQIRSGDGISNNEVDTSGSYEVYGGNGLMGYTERYNVTDNKIIIGRVGALCGNIHISRRKRFISDNALIFTPNSKANLEYLANYLVFADLNKLNTSSAQPLITGTKVMNVSIPLPTLAEQQEIVNYIERETAKVDAAIDKAERQIALLQELRQSVITEVVTGKRKVC